jgi:hypothetical protein
MRTRGKPPVQILDVGNPVIRDNGVVVQALPPAVEATRGLLVELAEAAAPEVERERKPVDSFGPMVILFGKR